MIVSVPTEQHLSTLPHLTASLSPHQADLQLLFTHTHIHIVTTLKDKREKATLRDKSGGNNSASRGRLLLWSCGVCQVVATAVGCNRPKTPSAPLSSRPPSWSQDNPHTRKTTLITAVPAGKTLRGLAWRVSHVRTALEAARHVDTLLSHHNISLSTMASVTMVPMHDHSPTTSCEGCEEVRSALNLRHRHTSSSALQQVARMSAERCPKKGSYNLSTRLTTGIDSRAC